MEERIQYFDINGIEVKEKDFIIASNLELKAFQVMHLKYFKGLGIQKSEDNISSLGTLTDIEIVNISDNPEYFI